MRGFAMLRRSRFRVSADKKQTRKRLQGPDPQGFRFEKQVLESETLWIRTLEPFPRLLLVRRYAKSRPSQHCEPSHPCRLLSSRARKERTSPRRQNTPTQLQRSAEH